MKTILQRSKRRLKNGARSLLERAGYGYLSSMGLDGLDLELAQILGHKRQGVFIEAGANDGVAQSNTYYLEKVLRWNGLLVEPLPDLAEKARLHRPGSTVVNAALVRQDYPHPTVTLERANLMSVINDGVIAQADIDHHLDRARGYEQVEGPATVEVPASPLSQILNQHEIPSVDFFSLDVEGYELEVLLGLDFQQCAIERILVESRPSTEAPIHDLLTGQGYELETEWVHPAYKNRLFRKPLSCS